IDLQEFKRNSKFIFAHEAWTILERSHERANTVKAIEAIDAFAIGDEYSNSKLVRKVLRSLLEHFSITNTLKYEKSIASQITAPVVTADNIAIKEQQKIKKQEIDEIFIVARREPRKSGIDNVEKKGKSMMKSPTIFVKAKNIVNQCECSKKLVLVQAE
ncbi:hypothetical protein Goshw_002455, partial [Gossypium schwendimanii]|nr:hypothetical protein [Gossypium schwendimanii]